MLDPRARPTPLYPERTQRVAINGAGRSVPWRPLGISALLFWIVVRWWCARLWKAALPGVAVRIRALLERYGGAWIKAGQLVAMRRDLFSPELCDALAMLQDRVSGFGEDEARRVLEADLGRPHHELFAEFRWQPIAAGSVGQVHWARLKGGREVAVKIQRPGVDQQFAADMRWVRRVVGLLERLRLMPHARWHEFVWELEQMFGNELDYRGEASSQQAMRERLRRHHVYVPRVYFELTTRRVLVMEFIYGVQMSEFIEASEHDRPRLERWLAANRIDPKRVGYFLYDTHTRQVFEDNLFHGDLHPGNIVLLRGSRLALIDFGSVGSIDATRLRKYYMLFQAIADEAFDKAADLTLLLSPNPPRAGSVVDAVKLELVRELKIWRERSRIRSLPYHDKSLTTLMAAMAVVLQRHRIAATWEFMRVNRAEVTMDSSLAYLLPEIDYFKMIRAYERQARQREVERALACDGGNELGLRALQAIEALDTAGERAYFEAEWVRQRAMFAMSSVSGMALAVSATLTMVMQLATLSLLLVPLLFLYQTGVLRPAAAWLRLEEVLDRAPRLSLAGVVVALALLAYARIGLGRLHRRINELGFRG